MEKIMRVSRENHPLDTCFEIRNKKIGCGYFGIIAGPCTVESQWQLNDIAEKVKASGATFLRGGAYKLRTNPYDFQGLGEKGLQLLYEAKKLTGLPIVTELTDLSFLDSYSDVDIIQVGARNMQNYDMLKALGACKKPVLLKRGWANTIEEFLLSAEYIMANGNSDIILCERGIRTFEKFTRNTLDLSAVSILKNLTHLPVIVDPSHATGIDFLVRPMCKAAICAGCDGLMIEVHNFPQNALCDGKQSVTCAEFSEIMADAIRLLPLEGKRL